MRIRKYFYNKSSFENYPSINIFYLLRQISTASTNHARCNRPRKNNYELDTLTNARPNQQTFNPNENL